MVTHLFRDFLLYEDQYKSAERFWSELFEELCSEAGQEGEWQPWIPKKYFDGTPILPEGNPIFDARNTCLDRAIRIIQSTPMTNEVEVAGWMKRFDYLESGGPGPTEELNISCELSEESAAISKALIKEWMRKEINFEEMEKIIQNALALI